MFLIWHAVILFLVSLIMKKPNYSSRYPLPCPASFQKKSYKQKGALGFEPQTFCIVNQRSDHYTTHALMDISSLFNYTNNMKLLQNFSSGILSIHSQKGSCFTLFFMTTLNSMLCCFCYLIILPLLTLKKTKYIPD